MQFLHGPGAVTRISFALTPIAARENMPLGTTLRRLGKVAPSRNIRQQIHFFKAAWNRLKKKFIFKENSL